MFGDLIDLFQAIRSFDWGLMLLLSIAIVWRCWIYWQHVRESKAQTHTPQYQTSPPEDAPPPADPASPR